MQVTTTAAASNAEVEPEQGQWLVLVATGLLSAAVAAAGIVSPLLGL
jgi:hypothetical protein